MAWNRPSANGPTIQKKSGLSPAVKGLLGGGIVVAVLGVATFFIFSGDDTSAPSTKHQAPRTIKETTPAKAAEYKEEVPKEDPDKAARRARYAKMKDMTPDERWEFLLEEAKKRPINLEPGTNRTFATGTEQIMSWVFTTRLGDLPPPLPQVPLLDEAHLAEIIISDNPILETDNEFQKESKEIVKEAKRELMEYIKNGGDVEQFLSYYHDQLRQAHAEWQESQKSVLQVIREDPDLAVDYINEVNGRLAKKGIRPVKIPPGLSKKLGIEE